MGKTLNMGAPGTTESSHSDTIDEMSVHGPLRAHSFKFKNDAEIKENGTGQIETNGGIILPNNVSLKGKNTANSGTIGLIFSNTLDNIQVGSPSTSASHSEIILNPYTNVRVSGGDLRVDAGKKLQMVTEAGSVLNMIGEDGNQLVIGSNSYAGSVRIRSSEAVRVGSDENPVIFTINGQYVRRYFVTDVITVFDNLTIAAGSYVNSSKTISVSGNGMPCIVSYNIDNGSSSGKNRVYCCPYHLGAETASNGNVTINYGIRNTHTAEAKIKLTVRVLYYEYLSN